MSSFRLQSLRGLRQAQSKFIRPYAWACTTGHVYRAPRCRWSSSNSSSSPDASSSTEKPYYITTPIFYVNAAPHIGHLYTMILADVLKRWEQLKGKEAFLCTGTDEHGMKIQQAAINAGLPPKEFCDGNSLQFRELAEAANISNDFFIRTTDPDHKHAVEQFWGHLKNGLPEELGLYKGFHEGWYCISDECFYAEDAVQPSVVPQTGRKMMASIETGNEVEWIKEDTWFFPLSKYKDQLLRFYDENPTWIKPAAKLKEVRHWVEHHLEDLSITRPASRLSWGIPDPEDKSNTIYVWVDALVNYLTKAGYGSQWGIESKDKGLWPADVQVIGKDIIRFHAVYWPAMLMAIGLPLPKKIICHNHWTMSNRKMSKSLGNVVNPFFALERWGVDPLRFFFMKNGHFSKDMGYGNEFIMAVYQKDLGSNIGNFLKRVTHVRSSLWSTHAAVEAARNEEFGNIAAIGKEVSEKIKYSSLDTVLDDFPEQFKAEMEQCQPNAALRSVFLTLSEANRFFTEAEPWTLAKGGAATPDTRTLINYIVYCSAEALRISGILLQPIMPTKAALLLDNLGVRPERRTLGFAAKGKDLDYGTLETTETLKSKSGKWNSLFPPPPEVEAVDAEVASPTQPVFDKSARLYYTAAAKRSGCMRLIGWNVAIATSTALLVPYEAHQVPKYHSWMQDPDIQEATASEPLTLAEEYENQQSWRTSTDKLTFIVCAPLEDGKGAATAREADADERMMGDINFFLHPYSSDDGDEVEEQNWYTGEVDVMIASPTHRGKGLGRAAVCTLLVYVQKHIRAILEEHAPGNGAVLKELMVKIKENNVGSRALFRGLGFVQKGEVNYFGEVVMLMLWNDVVKREWWERAEMGYKETRRFGEYARLVLQAISGSQRTCRPQLSPLFYIEMAPSVEALLKDTQYDPNLTQRVARRKYKPSLVIVDPDPSWPLQFEQLKARIEAAVGPAIVSVAHVGSTSVPGLPAKDVIDIDLTVKDVTDEASYVPALEAAGFHFLLREPGWHEHRFLALYDPQANLHVWGADSTEAERHRIFRDWLRRNEADRKLYAQTKSAAAEETNKAGETLLEYNERKQEVIRAILRKAFQDAGYLQ
ncbi:hypothetical protein G7046_g7554 [Stylonectria norvegica]|nr:hypothetical protein G7046_g7554 [Stylonectria norvegica]